MHPVSCPALACGLGLFLQKKTCPSEGYEFGGQELLWDHLEDVDLFTEDGDPPLWDVREDMEEMLELEPDVQLDLKFLVSKEWKLNKDYGRLFAVYLGNAAKQIQRLDVTPEPELQFSILYMAFLASTPR